MIELKRAHDREPDPAARVRQVKAMAQCRDDLAKLRLGDQ
jgi:hypothetical protein